MTGTNRKASTDPDRGEPDDRDKPEDRPGLEGLTSGMTDEEPLRVGVLLFHGVEPLDAIGPAQVFWSLEWGRAVLPPFRPIEVHLVAEDAGPIRAAYGLVIHPTTTYADCPSLDVLIVPGGGQEDDDTARLGRRFHAHHEPTLDFVRQHAASGSTRPTAGSIPDSTPGSMPVLTSSVCTGTFILAGAGVLAGRRGNTHWSARDELMKVMVDRGEPFELVATRVVDDGDVLSAGGVSSGIDLALHLVERLLGSACRDVAAVIIEQDTPSLA